MIFWCKYKMQLVLNFCYYWYILDNIKQSYFYFQAYRENNVWLLIFYLKCFCHGNSEHIWWLGSFITFLKLSKYFLTSWILRNLGEFNIEVRILNGTQWKTKSKSVSFYLKADNETQRDLWLHSIQNVYQRRKP